MKDRSSRHRGSPRKGWEEPLAVWGMYGLMALAIFITYARLPASDFYHVSDSGISGGASRVLVYLNFPVAFTAIALLGFALSSLIDRDAHLSGRGRRLIVLAAVLALLLCLVAGLPGVVDQGDLDARAVNVIPAIGVALVLLLTIVAIGRGARLPTIPWSRWDRNSAIVLGVLAFFALPWMLAELGIYIGDIPLLGRLFMSKAYVPPSSTLRAVHLGNHHGLDSLLFISAALVLGRKRGVIRPAALRAAISWYLALMVAYGAANYLNDIWIEQVVKRGWTNHEVPSMLVPKLSLSWGLLLLGMVAARYLLFHGDAEQRATMESTPAHEGPIAAQKR